jgi:hypothetical protein
LIVIGAQAAGGGVVLRDRVVEAELALLGQLQDRRGGELLGDRAEPKLVSGGWRQVPSRLASP